MIIEIKYSSFTAKLEQELKYTLGDKYDYMYYNEEEHKFEQLAVPYEDFWSDNEDYTPLIEMMNDIIDLPDVIKQVHITKPSDMHQILSLNMEDIFLLNGLLKSTGKSLLKYDVDKFVECSYDVINDILSIKFE